MVAGSTSEVILCGAVGYTIGENRYLNVTERRNLHGDVYSKYRRLRDAPDDAPRLAREPTVEEIMAAVGDPETYDQVVFWGGGEPTLRLYDVLDVAQQLRRHDAYVRIDTDGLASLVHGRDVAPDLEGIVAALSVSLLAHDAEVYARHCRPVHPHSYEAILNFVACAREFVPDITLTVIDGLPDVDIGACRDIAHRLGARFRRCTLDSAG